MKDKFLCPKCQSHNPKGALDCAFCGIVFAKYSVKQSNIQQIGQYRKDMNNSQFSKAYKASHPVKKVKANPQLQKLWQEVMKEYNNLDVHELFINKAIQTNGLPYAAQQYHNILSNQPHEEIAQQMQDRITSLAINIFTPEHIPRSEGFRFGISGLVIVLGTIIWLSTYLLSDLLLKFSFNLRYAELAGTTMVIIGVVYRFLKKRSTII